MRRLTLDAEVLGPWSLSTSRALWEGFAPCCAQRTGSRRWDPHGVPGEGRMVTGRRRGHLPRRCRLAGNGDLEGAATQVLRFLSLDVRGWPDVASPRSGHRRRPAAAARPAPVRVPLALRSRRLGGCYRSASASRRLPGSATTTLTATVTTEPSRHPTASATSTSTYPAGRPSTCAPSPTLRSKGGSTVRSCGRWNSSTPSRQCSRSRVWGRSQPNSSCCAGPTLPTGCPATNGASRLRSTNATGPTGLSARCRTPGVPTAPGPAYICGYSANGAPTRSAATIRGQPALTWGHCDRSPTSQTSRITAPVAPA